MLPESRLSEVLRLESALQEERALLGSQCAEVLPGLFSAPPHIPLPVNLLGIVSVCNKELRSIGNKADRLRKAWSLYALQNHFNKPHLYASNAYLESCPVVERVIKAKLLSRSVKHFRRRYNRDSMSFEDELSRLSNRYNAVQSRKRDYEIYYILANRYGAMSSVEFAALTSPGHVYLDRVQKAARRFQRRWRRYWRSTSDHRYKWVCKIQTTWRRYRTERKFRPLIRTRLRKKSRLKLISCVHKWREYQQMCRQMKDLLKWWLDYRRCETMVFLRWRNIVLSNNGNRQRKVAPFIMKRYVKICKRVFGAWRSYVAQMNTIANTKLILSRYPHFYTWKANVHRSILYRKQNRAANTVIRFMRIYRTQIILKRNRRIQQRVKQFASIVTAKNILRFKRRVQLAIEFERWLDVKKDQHNRFTVDVERSRLERLHHFLRKFERKYISRLNDHLASRDGQIQLREAALQLQNESGDKTLHHLSIRVGQDLREKLRLLVKQLAIHEFEIGAPPFIRCPDPTCRNVCTTVEQYENHALRVHHPDYSYLHLSIRDSSGKRNLLHIMVQRFGFGPEVNTTELLFELLQLRQISVMSSEYATRLTALTERFLMEGAPQPTLVPASLFSPLIRKLERRKSLFASDWHTHDLFLIQKEVCRRTLFQRILGLPNQRYMCWTVEDVISPTDHEDLEWHCFQCIYSLIVELGDEFLKDVQIQKVNEQRKLENERRRVELFEEYTALRLNQIHAWATDFKRKEMLISELAETATENSCKSISESVFLDGVTEIALERIVLENNMLREVIRMVEDHIIEQVFTILITAMVRTMLLLPEYRAKMVKLANDEYEIAKDLVGVNLPSHSFSRDGREVLHYDIAVLRIQTWIRRILAMNRMRFEFSRNFYKKFDPDHSQCYYVNRETGETSWYPPLIFARLYPNLEW